MITIEEIDNSEYVEFTSNIGEEVSNLGYQIMCYSRNTLNLQATEAVRVIGFQVNDLFLNTYNMRRIGQPVLQPFINDKNIMTYTLRFECAFDLDENRIYKN